MQHEEPDQSCARFSCAFEIKVSSEVEGKACLREGTGFHSEASLESRRSAELLCAETRKPSVVTVKRSDLNFLAAEKPSEV